MRGYPSLLWPGTYGSQYMLITHTAVNKVGREEPESKKSLHAKNRPSGIEPTPGTSIRFPAE